MSLQPRRLWIESRRTYGGGVELWISRRDLTYQLTAMRSAFDGWPTQEQVDDSVAKFLYGEARLTGGEYKSMLWLGTIQESEAKR